MLSHLGRLLEAPKSKVDSPRFWRITAALWDVPTFVSVFGLLFVVGDLFQNPGVWAIEILVGIFYVFGLLVTLGETREWGFVYFLAWKAKKAAAKWRSYWFFKFRYQVSRYIRHVGSRSGRDLFVRQYVRRFAEALGESIPPWGRPRS